MNSRSSYIPREHLLTYHEAAMERLPLELSNAVCGLLAVEDILQLRLVSRHSYQVATPFFPSEIHLIFTLKSFEKLLVISKHPVISQQIRSIYYEADTLDLVDRKQWEESITCGDYLESMPRWVPPDAPEEEHRARERELAEWGQQPRHSHTHEELDHGWVQYQRFYHDQVELCRQRYGIRELQEALIRLPNVKTFRMSMGHNLKVQSEYLKKVFSAGFKSPFGDDCRGHAAGVPQLRSMLLSMHEAGIKLQTFECGDVSWKLFRCSKKDLRAFATTLSQVRRLKLHLSTGMAASGNEIGVDLPECRRFLKNGRIRDMITHAKDLEYLEIKFDWWSPVFGIELGNIVGDQIFPRLASVTFSHVETNEEELIRFLERHKATLRSLHLDSMCLASGEWTSTVPRIRSSLELDECEIEGRLFSDDPRRDFDLGMIEWDDARFPEDRPRIEKRKAIEEWFTKGGECPFTDEWSEV